MFWESNTSSARMTDSLRRGFYAALIALLLSLAILAGNTPLVRAAPGVPLPEPRPASLSGNDQIQNNSVMAGLSLSDIPLPSERPPATGRSATVPAQAGPEAVADKADAPPAQTEGPLPVTPDPRPMGAPGSRLSEKDAALYREIFNLQEQGKLSAADEKIAALGDLRLLGHVLYQRFMHPTAYRSSYAELSDWMGFYADLPGAVDIYELALKRRPGHAARPRKPESVRGISSGLLGYFDAPVETYRSDRRRSRATQRSVAAKMRSLSRLTGRGYPTRALAILNQRETQNLLDDVEEDMLRGEIARSYLFYGKFDKAMEVAVAASDRSGKDAALAGWVAGLCSWIRKDYAAAAPYFERVAQSRYASKWTISAGAYWAARSYVRIRQPQKVSHWLKQAAANQRTFYGVIASRALGMRLDFSWDMPELEDRHLQEISMIPAGGRALALLDAGQPQLAEQELRRINPGEKALLREAMVSLAHEGGMPYLSMRLGSALENPRGGLYDVALYPEAPWQPQGGFKVDRALVQAFIRQESKFDPQAFNRSGASGLMQLMPDTASYLSNGRRFRGSARAALYDPVLNIDLGQRYLDRLLKNNHVDGNLFYLAAAYNAGPGNLKRWQRELANTAEDPLLFVETIPVAETRAFIERVMTNLWIYRLRYDQPTPSLTEVAEGRWPQYDHLDDPRLRFAQNRTW